MVEEATHVRRSMYGSKVDSEDVDGQVFYISLRPLSFVQQPAYEIILQPCIEEKEKGITGAVAPVCQASSFHISPLAQVALLSRVANARRHV